MSHSPDPHEFDHLQDLYRRTCEAFDRGDLTSAKARDIIVNLRHTDADGVVWKIDTKHSGRRAAFIREDGETPGGQAGRPATGRQSTRHHVVTGFDTLDQKYQDICAAFDRGEMSSTAARNEVLALRFTDAHGRTWKIDTQRSGKRAAFVQDHSAPGATPTRQRTSPAETPTRSRDSVRDTSRAPADRLPDQRDALRETEPTGRTDSGRPRPSVSPAEDRDDTDQPRQLRVKEIAFAATTLVAGLALLLGWSGGDDPSSETSTAPTVTIPMPTFVTTPGIVYPKLASFGARAAVPNDTEIEFGRSVQGRPLTVVRRGNPNGVRVLVVGCIHGNEYAGVAVTEILKKMTLPSNIDLWILPMLNPDGYELKIRQNANKVDLNRNFPVNWKPIGESGYWQWSGTAPATEPEVQSMMNLGNLVQPQLTIWYHQDYFRISPGAGKDGKIRRRYAKLVDLPILKIEGGSYSGTASMWSETMNKNDTTSMTVEFGKGLREGEAQNNATAITTVVNEFYAN